MALMRRISAMPLRMVTVTSSSSSLIRRCVHGASCELKVEQQQQQIEKSFVGMKGSEIFHEMMHRHNVEQVFGYPGGAILPVFDAIYNSPYFNFVLPRHEQGAGHMAEGYARVSGKPGVCIVTSGPGATNTITPLQDALSDGTPLVVFSGQVPTFAMGTDAFQEADIVGITRSCTKWNVLVKNISELPRRINEAFYIATSGRPGPVLVDLPKDVTAGVLTSEPSVAPYVPSDLGKMQHESRKLSQEDFLRIADLINQAERPIIYAGQGIVTSSSHELLKQLAEQGNIPVTTTLMGLGAFDEESDLSLRMLGMHGSVCANYAMQEADVIIALGARFDDRVTGNVKHFARGAVRAARENRGGIIHFEISAKQCNKVVASTENVLGCVKKNLTQLIPHVRFSERSPWFSQIQDWKRTYPFSYVRRSSNPESIMPQEVIEELERQTKHCKDKLIVSTGVGQHQMWAAQYLKWRHPRTIVSSGGLGTMGFGLPAAIGAKVAMPNHIVVDIDGDASFSMTGMELITAAQYNIGVKVLILNNRFQGMVRQWQDLFYDEHFSHTEMANPCFKSVAESMGCKGLKLTKRSNLATVMEEFLAHDGPVLLDASVENDGVYPMVPAGAALHEVITCHPGKKG